MSDTTPPVFKRRTFARDDGKGNSVAEWTLTPTSITDPVQIIAEPRATLPIIFVPGIMGSNLQLTNDVGKKSKGDAVWLMNSKSGAAWDWARADAALRQKWLNPATTEVFDGGEVPASVASIGDAGFIREHRYWGEVSAMSYGDFLVWLQRTLNHAGGLATWRAVLGQTDFAALIAKGMAFKPLAEEAVTHATDFRMPVYACGYNWLQSNSKAANALAARVTEVIEANNSKSYHCEKVILVTHSMGGLVARACSELPGMGENIAGIVHGVMPANGAAVAYKRVRSGTEGSAGVVIGDTAEKVTAVFANSPGALQLLPNKQYGSGWLKLGMAWGGSFRTLVVLPRSDPYDEIYEQRGRWWSLVREELINPGKLKGHRGWSDYLVNIKMAGVFHAQLGAKYHPNTYTFHGEGMDPSDGLTWGNVGWFGIGSDPARDSAADELLASRLTADDGKGHISAGRGLGQYFVLSAKDSTGDGTVPHHSGNAPAQAGVQATYHFDLGAEGHEGAYRVDMARRATLHAILHIAQTVRLPT